MEENRDFKVKSLAKALQILESFSVASPELGVTEIAKQTGLQKATVHNVLSTFQQFGYVKQDPKSEKYSLDLGLLQYSFRIMNNQKIRQVFLPYLLQIAAKTGHLCMLAVPYRSQVFYLESSISCSSNRAMRSIAGESAPFYCTALGKAMLAFLPEAEIEDYLSRETFAAFTDYTITDPQTLRGQLHEIRRSGYAVDNMEHEYGVCCVGVPIFSNTGAVAGAVSVTGPASEFDPSAIAAYAACIRDVISPVQNYLVL